MCSIDTNYVRYTNPNSSENDELPYDLEIQNAKSMENPVISGRRKVDLEYFLNALKSLKHEGFGCSFFDLSVLSEKSEGLYSIISLRCSVFNTIATIRTGNSNINLATKINYELEKEASLAAK
ncbi:hypothetical protein FQA39_LY10416 [Lamprigera yunnana]|nr:hypothetical protein FQA39_LY10416 [Lamprigera yunnana]